MESVISKFEGEYEFLSNFYPSKIIYEPYIFEDRHLYADTVEHAFQAAKAADRIEELNIIMAPTPGKAKRLGRKCQLRSDWEEVKDNVMRKFLCKKFAIPELRQKLLDTGDAYLIEGNHWHDNHFGICYCEKCNGRGQNKLGQLLMEIRKEIRDGLV